AHVWVLDEGRDPRLVPQHLRRLDALLFGHLDGDDPPSRRRQIPRGPHLPHSAHTQAGEKPIVIQAPVRPGFTSGRLAHGTSVTETSMNDESCGDSESRGK